MNNKWSLFIAALSIFILYGCSNKIILHRIGSEKQVVARFNVEHNVITVIEFPFRIVIDNFTPYKKEFGKINYEYNNEKKGVGLLLYQDGVEIKNNQLQYVRSNKSINFLAYTGHFTEFSDFTQKQLKPYVNKMLKLNQDTLHIGTVTEFKEKHGELFMMLTEKDTISIRFYDIKNKHFSNRKAIPANW